MASAEIRDHVIITIKRIDLDEKIAKAASRAGAKLVEGRTVTDARFFPIEDMWTVETATEDGIKKRDYRARVLICADGAPSAMARKLRIVKTEPNGISSRAIIQAGTHNFNADAVIFYPRQLLPGYSALFKHSNDDLGFYTYILPGGPSKNEDAMDIHKFCIKDPYISKALGPSAVMREVRCASLRLGGTPQSHSDNCLVVGDAAGQADPLTGEGIQFAMEAAKIAAEVVVEGFDKGDLSERFLKRYHDRWMKQFGAEFRWSFKFTSTISRWPIIIDAACLIIKERGYEYFLQWALVMTGTKSKVWFLRPDFVFLLLLKILQLSVSRITIPFLK